MVIVTGSPRSGTTHLCLTLSRYLGKPIIESPINGRGATLARPYGIEGFVVDERITQIADADAVRCQSLWHYPRSDETEAAVRSICGVYDECGYSDAFCGFKELLCCHMDVFLDHWPDAKVICVQRWRPGRNMAMMRKGWFPMECSPDHFMDSNHAVLVQRIVTRCADDLGEDDGLVCGALRLQMQDMHNVRQCPDGAIHVTHERLSAEWDIEWRRILDGIGADVEMPIDRGGNCMPRRMCCFGTDELDMVRVTERVDDWIMERYEDLLAEVAEAHRV